MNELDIVKVWVISALLILGAVIYFVNATAAPEVNQDWTLDCHGTKVTVEQLELYHFKVSCNGLVVDSPEAEQLQKARHKRNQVDQLSDEAYPAPGDIEPYPAPSAKATPTYGVSPTKTPRNTPTLAPTTNPNER